MKITETKVIDLLLPSELKVIKEKYSIELHRIIETAFFDIRVIDLVQLSQTHVFPVGTFCGVLELLSDRMTERYNKIIP